ncbi:MAG: hypothetical protein RIT28_824 [Pseudomonadota bacterium]
MDSLDAVVLAFESGLPVVLQRVPRSLSAQTAADILTERLGRPVSVVVEPFTQPEGVRVIDGRPLRAEQFERWDQGRHQLGDAVSPLLVLLDVNSGTTLLQRAPHLASWSGGVRLPLEREVRLATSPEEIKLGQAALRRALHAMPELREAHYRAPIGVLVGSDRLFRGEGGVAPLVAAREALDEGILYVTRLIEEVALD